MTPPLSLPTPTGLPPSVRRFAAALTALALGVLVFLLPATPALADSGDRAQIENATSHSLGLFARYKKDPAGQPARFYVLGPGHQTDDDYELVALLIPPGVSLEGGPSAEAVAGGAAPRLALIPEGLQLRVQDPAPADPSATAADDVGYAFGPATLELAATNPLVTEVPAFDQAALDLQPETAPLD